MRCVHRFFLLCSWCGLSGCVSLGLQENYDSRPLRFGMIDLYSQMERHIDPGVPSWTGDWIFRRERLELVDQSLQIAKPDMLFLQNVMQRGASAYDSDQAILGAGALNEYQWQSHVTREHTLAGETARVAVACAAPMRVDPFFSTRSGYWSLGADGYLFASTVIFEGLEIPVMLLRVSPGMAMQNLWYFYAYRYIRDFIEKHHLCSKRLVISGEFWGSYGQSDYQILLDLLQLKDTSISFCSDMTKCLTADPDNAMYQGIQDVPEAARNLRILVHHSAQVFDAKRTLHDERKPSRQQFKEGFYGIHPLEPAPYYGWEASVRFPRCGGKE